MLEPLEEPLAPEQGAIVNCVYCSLVHPELEGACPRCKGTGGGFKAAQMMDRETSSRMILDMLSEEDLTSFGDKEQLISLLGEIDLYNFDFTSALALRIRDMED